MQEAVRLDGLAVRAARGSGALDLEIGEVLLRLFEGNRHEVFGCTRQGDYACERLGVAARTALGWAGLARGLAQRPLLRRAVVGGRVSARKALTVMRAASGENEAAWTMAAMTLSGGELERRVRNDGFDPALDTFDVEALVLHMNTNQYERVDAALEMAELVVGPGAPDWQRLEAMCQEWLGWFGRPDWPTPEPGSGPGLALGPADVEKLLSPELPAVDLPNSAIELDRLARELVRHRHLRDEELGRALEPIRDSECYRDLGFESFDDYVRERLLIAPRTARQRMWLEQKLRDLPALRKALRTGQVTLSKALLIANDASSSDIDARIEDAASTTFQQLDREATEKQDRQNRANGTRRMWGPADALETIQLAMWAASALSAENGGSFLSSGESLALIADHFVEVWKDNFDDKHIPAARREIFARHRGTRRSGLCAVPGCSATATHDHHVRFRSQGGSNERTNRIALCAACHLRCVHTGKIVVTGRAGERLVWLVVATGERWTTTGDDSVRRSVRREVG